MKESDSLIENLERHDAIEKMKELVDHTNVCMFCTQVGQVPFDTRPMSTQAVDDDGTFYFFSDAESEKNFEIRNDARVLLMYSNPSKSEFMTVYGNAAVSKDRSKIEQLWSPIAKAWFKKGKDDPSLTLIKVVPEQAYYWDTQSGKMISFLKILASVVTDKSHEDGVQGRLSL